MDYETVSADDFGASLRGVGLNIVVTDVVRLAGQLERIFDMKAHRLSPDFAILTYGQDVFQLHSDGTYTANPLLNLLPENPPRGAGLEIRLYDSNPEDAVARAQKEGWHVLQEPTRKPHGLVEAYVLCDDGYAWVPSRPV